MFVVLTCGLCLVLFSGCGMKEKADRVVEQAYYAAGSGNYEEAAQYLSSIDFLNMRQETGGDYRSPAWPEFWEFVMGTDDFSSMTVEEVRTSKNWAKVYMTIQTSHGEEFEHEQLLFNQEKNWKIITIEHDVPSLARRN